MVKIADGEEWKMPATIDDPAILDSMGWVLYRQGDLVQAASYLRRALALAQDDEIAAHLGEVLWQMGETDRARSVWNAAMEEDPDNRFVPEVRKRLGVDE